MEAAYTSTRSINSGTRLNILKLQTQLIKAQEELASGRHADIGVTLGGRTSETVALRQQWARLTTIIDTNAVVKTRIDSSQNALSSLIDMSEDFVGALIASRDAEGGATVAQGEAKAKLIAFTDILNSSVAGEYLFAGINTTVKPLTDYYADPIPANRLAVASAFTTAFGTTQLDPANINITPSAMQNFLDTDFAALFDLSGWAANWSTASDINITSRISMSEDVESSSNAGERAFRKLAEAFTMVADLGVENLNKGAFGVVVDTAMRIASEALQDLAAIQARLGTASARIEASNQKMSLQRDILNTQIDVLERVDSFEASARVTTLLTQLEISYSLTATVQRLTILNYL